MMRYVITLAFLALGITNATAQAPVRPCIPTINATTGAQQCQDTTVPFPFPIRSGGYGTGTLPAPQFCQISPVSAATKLTTASCTTGTILANATVAQICVEVQGVRYTSSGVVVPTSIVGIPVASGTCFQYSGPLSTITFIQQATGAAIDVETFP